MLKKGKPENIIILFLVALIILFVCIFWLGFFVGNRHGKSQCASTLKQEQKIQLRTSSKGQLAENSSSNQQTATAWTQKQYGPTGNLQIETTWTQGIKQKENVVKINDIHAVNSASSDEKLIQVKEAVQNEQNWAVAALYPLSLSSYQNGFQWQSMSLQISRKIFLGVSLLAQSDLKFQKPMMGVQVAW